MGQYLQNKFPRNSLCRLKQKPKKLVLFSKAQNYPQINNKRKQETLRSMTNHLEHDNVCTNTKVVWPLQTPCPSCVVQVTSTGLSLCVVFTGRSLRSVNLSLMWNRRPSVCHVASVIIIGSEFMKSAASVLRNKLSADGELRDSRVTNSLTFPTDMYAALCTFS